MNTISPRRRCKGLQVGIGLGAAVAVAEFVTTCAVYGFSGMKDFSMALVCGAGTVTVCAAAWELWLSVSVDSQPEDEHDAWVDEDGFCVDRYGNYLQAPGVEPAAGFVCGPAGAEQTDGAAENDDFDWYFSGTDPVAAVPGARNRCGADVFRAPGAVGGR